MWGGGRANNPNTAPRTFRHVHVYIHAHICIYIHSYTHIYVGYVRRGATFQTLCRAILDAHKLYIYIRTSLHIYIYIHIYTYTRCRALLTHIYCIYARTSLYIYIYIYICHTYIYTSKVMWEGGRANYSNTALRTVRHVHTIYIHAHTYTYTCIYSYIHTYVQGFMRRGTCTHCKHCAAHF